MSPEAPSPPAEQTAQALPQPASYFDIRLANAAHAFESVMPAGSPEEQGKKLESLQQDVQRIMGQLMKDQERVVKKGLPPTYWPACQALDAYIELARMNFEHSTPQAAEVYRLATQKLGLGYDQTLRPSDDPDFNPKEERSKLSRFNTLQDVLQMGFLKGVQKAGSLAVEDAASGQLLSRKTEPVERNNPLWSEYYGRSSPLGPKPETERDKQAEIDRIMTSTDILDKPPEVQQAELEALRKSAGEGIEKRVRQIEGSKEPDPHANKRWTKAEVGEEQIKAVIEGREPHPMARPTTPRQHRRMQQAGRILRRAENAKRDAHLLQRLFGARIGTMRPLFDPGSIPSGKNYAQLQGNKKRASDLGTPEFRGRLADERLMPSRSKAEIVADARYRSLIAERDTRMADIERIMEGGRAPTPITLITRTIKRKYDRRTGPRLS